MLRSDGNEFDEVFIFFTVRSPVRRGVLSERGRTDERTVKKCENFAELISIKKSMRNQSLEQSQNNSSTQKS